MIYNKKISLILFVSLILFLININYVFAFQGEVNINTTNINIYDDEINFEINIYNNTNVTQLYNLIPHINPFEYKLSSNSFRLDPNTSGKFNLIIKPLSNSNDVFYKGTLELNANSTSKNIFLNINQNSNRVCDIKVNTFVSYFVDINRYLLSVSLENKGTYPENISLLNINNTNMDLSKFNSYRLNPNESKDVKFTFDSNSTYININYICNSVNKDLKVELPKKTKKKLENFSSLSSFINLRNINFNIFNSVFLYILLVVLLLVLILSFTTKYIKYIYHKS